MTGEPADTARTRTLPTFTHVPEVSLNSSLKRPSNSRLFRFVGLGETAGVTCLEVALFIDGLLREIGTFPITGRNVRAARANLQPAGIRHELDLASGDRQADIAGALDREMHDRCAGCSLGRAPRGDHRHPQAARFDRDLFEPTP